MAEAAEQVRSEQPDGFPGEIGMDDVEVTRFEGGKAITINAKGEVVDERELPQHPVFDNYQPSTGSETGAAGVETQPAGEAEAGATGSEQDATGTNEQGEPTLEERYAKLEEENRRLKQVNTLPVEQPRIDPPKAPELPDIDLSDMPDVFDREKFDSNEAAQEALKAHVEAKLKERDEAHQKHLQEHHANVQQQQTDATAAQAQQRNERRAAEVVAEIRQKSGDLSDADFQTRFSTLANLRHPEWQPNLTVVDAQGRQTTQPNQTPPNTVHVNLVRGREAYMDQRAAMGLSVADHESVGDIIAEQVRDPEFAQAVSAMVPNTVEAGNLLLAITQTERPVALLRHFTTEAGQAQAAELSKDRGAARMSPQQRIVLANEIRGDVMRIHDSLGGASPAESEGGQVQDQIPQPGQIPQPQPGQIPQPVAPAGAPTPRPSRAAGMRQAQTGGGRPAGRQQVIDPFTDAGSDAIVAQAMKERTGWRRV